MLSDWINLNKTQKTNYFKIRLNKGLCKSLKTERNEDFLDFMELFKNHPDHDTKIQDVKDLSIIHNKRNSKYFEINLIKSNGIVEDISYRCCINERNAYYNLNSALRYAIEPQIQEFRDKTRLICSSCNSTENIQIDHIIMFKTLVSEFLKTFKDIPTDFDDNEYNGCKFKKDDNEFENKWCHFHKSNAQLQCLCLKCNLTKSKK